MTLLVVGEGESMTHALVAALKRRNVDCHTSTEERVGVAAMARRPHMILAVGDATQNGAATLLAALSRSAITHKLPVAVLADAAAGSLTERVAAFNAGAASMIMRAASAEGTASRVLEMLSRVAQLPRGSQPPPGPSQVELDEIYANAPATTPGELESPLFSSRTFSRPPEERASLQPRTPQARRATAWRGARVLLIHDDSGRADALAQEIRARGGVVVVSGRSEQGLVRARELDPELVILDSGAVVGPALDVVQVIERDPRLRWATRIVVRWDEVWPVDAGIAHMEQLADRILPVRSQEESLLERAQIERSFHTTLVPVGPCRSLRSLALCDHVLTLTTLHQDRRIQIDLADGLLAGASVFLDDSRLPVLEGLEALALWMEQTDADVRIERRRAPSFANVLLPVDVALATASREHSSDAAMQKLAQDVKTLNVHLEEDGLNADSTERSLQPLDEHGNPRPRFEMDPFGATTRKEDLVDESQQARARLIVDALPAAPRVPSVAPMMDLMASTPPLSQTPAARSQKWFLIIGVIVLAIAAVITVFAFQRVKRATSPRYLPPMEPMRPAAPQAPAKAATPVVASVAPTPVVAPAPAPAPAPEPVVPAPEPAAQPADANDTLDSEGHYEAGNVALAANDLNGAERHYLRSIRLDQNNTHAMLGLAKLYTRTRPLDGVHYAEKLVSARRRRADYRVVLGDAYRAAGMSDRANEAYRAALEIEPGMPEATRRLR